MFEDTFWDKHMSLFQANLYGIITAPIFDAIEPISWPMEEALRDAVQESLDQTG
jgi:hypothetical protein